MKAYMRNVQRWVALLMLAVVLSGCALGQRRNGTNTATQPSATRQSQPAPLQQPTAPAAAENTPSAGQPTENTSPAGQPAEDDSAAELLNLINSLDATNQAGDALDDLP